MKKIKAKEQKKNYLQKSVDNNDWKHLENPPPIISAYQHP